MATLLTLELTPLAAESCVSAAGVGSPELPVFEERTGHILPKLEQLINNKSLSPFQKVEILIDDYVARAQQKLLFYRVLVQEQMLEKNPIITDLINNIKQKNTNLNFLLVRCNFDSYFIVVLYVVFSVKIGM